MRVDGSLRFLGEREEQRPAETTYSRRRGVDCSVLTSAGDSRPRNHSRGAEDPWRPVEIKDAAAFSPGAVLGVGKCVVPIMVVVGDVVLAPDLLLTLPE